MQWGRCNVAWHKLARKQVFLFELSIGSRVGPDEYCVDVDVNVDDGQEGCFPS